MIRGRFAPSPTGELHLGGARTALCAWLSARAGSGELVLRIEDLDGPRVVPGSEAQLLEDLRWLGLDWDEGPDTGGEYGPYRQSERLARYREVIERLLAEGRAFPCFCSRAEVARAAQAPHGPGDDGPRYPGTCRALTRDQISERGRLRQASVRLRVEPGEIAFTDLVHGAHLADVAAQVGDFVLLRADGVPAYQLAVALDDATMKVTEVVRGDDLLSSTARQLLVQRALGLPPPARFAHVPLVLGPDGVRLSKRHGAIGVRAFAARGWTAPRLVGLLGSTLGLCPGDAEIAPRDLLNRFDFARLPRTPTRLDLAALTPL